MVDFYTKYAKTFWWKNSARERISEKFVPRLLTDDQKQQQLKFCMEFQAQVRNDPDFLSKVVTGNKCWIYGKYPETKQQFLQQKTPSSPWPKKVQQVKSHVAFSTAKETSSLKGNSQASLQVKFDSDILKWLREDTRGEVARQMARE